MKGHFLSGLLLLVVLHGYVGQAAETAIIPLGPTLAASPSQLRFTCSKSTIETLEKAVKYNHDKSTRTIDVIDAVLVFLLLTLNIFNTFF